MVTHRRHLSSLSPEEITALAGLLALPLRLLDPTTGIPSDLWLASQARLITTLPKPLLRPHNFLSRLSISANRHLNLSLEDVIPECAVLCTAHHDLNPWLVRRVFLLVNDEATARVVPLEGYLARRPPPGWYGGGGGGGGDDGVATAAAADAEEVRGLVDRLHALLSLSTGAGVLDRVGCPAGPGRWLPRVRGGCEACVLGVVGAHAPALRDLRAGLRGRAHRRHRTRGAGDNSGGGEPALLRLVEAWIAGLGEEVLREEVLRESRRLGKAVRRVRTAVRKGMKKKHRCRVDEKGWHRPPRSHGSGGGDGRGGSSGSNRTGSSVMSSSYEQRKEERGSAERPLEKQHLSSREKAVLLGGTEEQLGGMSGADSWRPGPGGTARACLIPLLLACPRPRRLPCRHDRGPDRLLPGRGRRRRRARR